MSDAVSYQKFLFAELNISAEEQDIVAQIKGMEVQLSSRELIIETPSRDQASSKRKSLSMPAAGWEVFHGRKNPFSQSSPKFSTAPQTASKPLDPVILQGFGGESEHSISEVDALLLESPDSSSAYVSSQSRGGASLSSISNSSSTPPNSPSCCSSKLWNVVKYAAGTLSYTASTAKEVACITLANSLLDFYSEIYGDDIFEPGDYMGSTELLDTLETNAPSSSDTSSLVSQDSQALVLYDAENDISSSSKALISHPQYNSGSYSLSLNIKKDSTEIQKLQEIWQSMQKKNRNAGNPYQFTYKVILNERNIFLTLIVTPTRGNPLSLPYPALIHGAAGDVTSPTALALYTPDIPTVAPNSSLSALSQKQLQYIYNRIMSNISSDSLHDRVSYHSNTTVQDLSSSRASTAMQIEVIEDDQIASSQGKKTKKLRETSAASNVGAYSSSTTSASDTPAPSRATNASKTENDKYNTQDKNTERLYEKGAVKNILSGASHGVLGIVQSILALLAFIVFPANLICKAITGSYLHSYPWEACKANIAEAGLHFFGGEKEVPSKKKTAQA